MHFRSFDFEQRRIFFSLLYASLGIHFFGVDLESQSSI